MNCRIVASKNLVLGFFAVGLVTATILSGCSSSSDNGGGGSGGTGGKDAGAAGKGGSAGLAGQSAGGTTVAPGGSVGPDASMGGSAGGSDAMTSGAAGTTGTTDAGLPDVAQPDAGRSDAVDAPMDVPADVLPVGDGPQQSDGASDGSSSDGGDGSSGAACYNASWAKTYGTTTVGLPALLPATDKDGNLFVSSTYYADPTTGLNLGLTAPVPSAGGANFLVGRIDPATGSFVWAKGFGDDSDQSATGTAVDKSGRLGTTGVYQGSMTFNTNTFANTSDTPFAFVAAFGSDGTALWGKSVDLGGPAPGGQLTIAAHPNFDDFVVCGYATNAVTDLVTGGTPNGDGLKDIVVAKIKGDDGSVVWARLIGGAGDQTCNAVAIADDGNVLIAGGYLGTLDFGSGPFPVQAGVVNVLPWVAKLSGSTGSTILATSFNMVGTKGRADIRAIAVDASGNAVIGGQITRGPILFGTTTLTPTGTSALADAFAVKLDTSLKILWAKS